MKNWHLSLAIIIAGLAIGYGIAHHGRHVIDRLDSGGVIIFDTWTGARVICSGYSEKCARIASTKDFILPAPSVCHAPASELNPAEKILCEGLRQPRHPLDDHIRKID